jgi:hypothetical protein
VISLIVVKQPKDGHMHPVNLALRFFLEVAALAGFGILAWNSGSGWLRIPLMVLSVCTVMAIWGVFAVPDDPSRSGRSPFPVPGTVRLCLELLILFGGAAAFYLGGYRMAAAGLSLLVLIHYGLSIDRVIWLLQR